MGILQFQTPCESQVLRKVRRPELFLDVLQELFHVVEFNVTEKV